MSVDWFAPHFEIRFPKLGELAVQGALVELRQELEPWHVMGEEGGAGGTARYVELSLERVEVKASRVSPDRYAVQWPRPAYAPNRARGRIYRGSALPRVAAMVCAASDNRYSFTADIRYS